MITGSRGGNECAIPPTLTPIRVSNAGSPYARARPACRARPAHVVDAHGYSVASPTQAPSTSVREPKGRARCTSSGTWSLPKQVPDRAVDGATNAVMTMLSAPSAARGAFTARSRRYCTRTARPGWSARSSPGRGPMSPGDPKGPGADDAPGPISLVAQRHSVGLTGFEPATP